MGFLAFIFMMLIPVGFAGLIVFDIFIATKKISSVSKRTRQMQEDAIRAAEQRRAQNEEYAEKVDELNKEVKKYVRVKCPYCGSEADVEKGIQFTCEHCGFVSANIL